MNHQHLHTPGQVSSAVAIKRYSFRDVKFEPPNTRTGVLCRVGTVKKACSDCASEILSHIKRTRYTCATEKVELIYTRNSACSVNTLERAEQVVQTCLNVEDDEYKMRRQQTSGSNFSRRFFFYQKRTFAHFWALI